ncbi:MAG: uroporphyrinogen decarboxylase [Proteobacteria bacterium]|nr:uroporphyrinogen decarboxylase [Pseudomonadota bacterium]
MPRARSAIIRRVESPVGETRRPGPAARERFLRAARGQPVDRPPVWLMRQAGRYLPEYRRVREGSSFLEMCRDPDTAAEVSLQPYRRFGMDGVVVFSDILLPLAGLGIELDFDPGPRIANPIRSRPDLANLDGSAAGAIAPTCEAIRRIKAELGDAAAVIGFAGAPWTLAAYVTESPLSRELTTLVGLSYREPALVDRLLDRLAEVAAETLCEQIAAGADALQIFDTWADVLSPERFERFAGRALRRVVSLLPADRPPLILFARGSTHLLEALADVGPEVVSVDWRIDFAEAARRVGGRVSLQGNLDPLALTAPRERIEAEVAAMLAKGRAARGHIANLGHGVLPSVPPEGVGAFVQAVQRSGE